MEKSKYLSEDGTVLDTPFWFCSAECYHAEITDRVPKKYQHETVEDDPEAQRYFDRLDHEYNAKPHERGYSSERDCVRKLVAEYVETWQSAQELCIEEALSELHKEIIDASIHYREELLKKQQQDELAFSRMITKAEYENEQFDKREAEKEAKRRLEEEAARAEEARWTPKTLKL